MEALREDRRDGVSAAWECAALGWPQTHTCDDELSSGEERGPRRIERGIRHCRKSCTVIATVVRFNFGACNPYVRGYELPMDVWILHKRYT